MIFFHLRLFLHQIQEKLLLEQKHVHSESFKPLTNLLAPVEVEIQQFSTI